MHRRPVALPVRRPLAGLLVCALLLAQTLGLLHRLQHANGPSPAHAHGVLEALFAQHHDAGDCQIFDQLSHAGGVGFGVVEPGAMPPAPPPASAPRAPKVAAQSAGYLARGPPRTA